MRHINIPIFIPHLGCPNQCVFCNQRTISGVEEFDISSVVKTIEENLSTKNKDDEVEIAFFGGSFTGIDRDLMINLLEIAYGYVRQGSVKSIRCSTRPDYINDEIISILKSYGVKTVELGLQSSSDKVLLATKRGHSRNDEIRACNLIKSSGLSLVGQMMIGLPDSDISDELETADFIIKCGADAARIYPTVVFFGTELCEMAKSGCYTPLSTEEAIKRSALVAERLLLSGVKIIRIGLCASDNLSSSSTCYAGPNHPALGELVAGEIYYNLIRKTIMESGVNGAVVEIHIPRGELSKAIGHKKKNKLRLADEFSPMEIKFVENDFLGEYDVRVQAVERQ